MDADRFDALVRSLSPGSSRRTVLTVVASGLLALSANDLAAKKKKKKGKKSRKKCNREKTPCGDECCDAGDGCFEFEDTAFCYTQCNPVCTSPQVCCGEDCTDVTADPKNCRRCGTACAENEVCRFANCICDGPGCPAPGSTTPRCCPSPDGVCCPSGKCCPAGEHCTEDGRCCLNGTHTCFNGLCCPDGSFCGAPGECLYPDRELPGQFAERQRAIPATPAL